MPLTRQDKEQQIGELTEQVKAASAGVLVDYCGLTVAEVTELRKKLREANVEFKVYKNSVLKFASKNAGYDGLEKFLDGPNAIAISQEDPIQPAKILVEFAKSHEKLEIKSGFVDGKIADVEEIKALAELPPREVLLAKVLGGFNAPISGLANVLSGTIRSLAYALNSVIEKQGA